MSVWYLNADTGNDTTGDGSSGSPYLTISKAHTVASSGDTVVCQDSTAHYTFINQHFTKNLTIQGQQTDGSGAIFDGGGNEYYWATVRGGYVYNPTVELNISNLTFYDIQTPGAGKYYNAVSTLIGTINNCVFHELYNNDATGSVSGGIVGANLYGGLEDHDLTIKNCLFYGFTGTPALMGGHHTSGHNDTGTVRFINNTVYSDGTYTSSSPTLIGIYQVGAVTYTFKNNIFYSTTTIDFVRSLGVTWFTFNYNDTYGLNASRTPTGTGNITVDPLFVDVATDNFNLKTTSPCTNTGELL